MAWRQCCSIVIVVVLASLLGVGLVCAQSPTGTLTVAVATFGNERWLPHLYPGAEDVVLKPMMENLLNRDPKTGALAPMLAERWEVLEEGRAWRFYLRKGVQFHDGHGEMTAEDVKFTLATIAKEGSANSLGPEFRLIKAWTLRTRIPLPSASRSLLSPLATRSRRVCSLQWPLSSLRNTSSL